MAYRRDYEELTVITKTKMQKKKCKRGHSLENAKGENAKGTFFIPEKRKGIVPYYIVGK